MDMCRACLSTGKGMIVMDEIFLQNYNNLTNLNLKLTEVTLYTCTECYKGANFCVEFRNKCIASDFTLKNILFPVKKEKHEDEEDQNFSTIKTDPKLEDEVEYLIDYSLEYQLIETDDNVVCFAKAEQNEDQSNISIIKIKPEDGKVVVKKKCTKKCTEKKAKKMLCLNYVVVKICPKSFENEEGLKNHLDNHTLQKLCVLCGEHFTNLPHLLSHRMEHLPEEQKRCHICFKKYIRAPSLEFHYMRVHQLAEKDSLIQCKQCFSKYNSGKRLVEHIKDCHSEITYTCDYCALSVKNKKQLIHHIKSYHETKLYRCDLCAYTSKFSSGVNAHKLRRHSKLNRISCKFCDQLFKSQKSKDKHSCKYATTTICPVCGKILTGSSSSVRAHLKTHEDVRYKCNICEASYRTRHGYRTHMDKHEGKPKFRCEYCQRCFYFPSVLIKHRRTHTGEKPYVCSVCKRGFTGNHNLKVHMKVHGIMN